MPIKQPSKFVKISIDVPLKDHLRVKLLAAAEDLSLEAFVLECIYEKIDLEKKPNAKTRKAIMDVARKGKTIRAKSIADLANL